MYEDLGNTEQAPAGTKLEFLLRDEFDITAGLTRSAWTLRSRGSAPTASTPKTLPG